VVLDPLAEAHSGGLAAFALDREAVFALDRDAALTLRAMAERATSRRRTRGVA
jgi:hypothetical protein